MILSKVCLLPYASKHTLGRVVWVAHLAENSCREARGSRRVRVIKHVCNRARATKRHQTVLARSVMPSEVQTTFQTGYVPRRERRRITRLPAVAEV